LWWLIDEAVIHLALALDPDLKLQTVSLVVGTDGAGCQRAREEWGDGLGGPCVLAWCVITGCWARSVFLRGDAGAVVLVVV
jgi:hypothetical protein